MKTIFTNKQSAKVINISPESEERTIDDSPEGFGQLPVDVLENNKEVMIVAPLAGVDLDGAEVVINNDVLTIKGKRNMDSESYGFKRKDYFLQECFWGEFSRSVILPPNADTQNIEATEKNQILYIKIPKRMNIQMRIVKIKSK